jgi:hypothetical protein
MTRGGLVGLRIAISQDLVQGCQFGECSEFVTDFSKIRWS